LRKGQFDDLANRPGYLALILDRCLDVIYTWINTSIHPHESRQAVFWTSKFMRSLLHFAFVVFLFLAACAPTVDSAGSTPVIPNRATLVVLAAASTTEPFQEIGLLFEAAHPEVRVSFNFAGSQQLAQQLANGSPADVFASANHRQMDVAVETGRIDAGQSVQFAGNRLVVIVPKHNPAGILSLQDLAKPGIKLILAAKEVPVGQYSLTFLENATLDVQFSREFQDQVLQNVVSFEDNVKTVLTKVVLGEADAGIVYSSDISPEAAEDVAKIEIPDHLNVIASYPIAIVADSRNPDLAQAFIEMILSPEGQQILSSYGFLPAPVR
jgi:molybdate transport system substrate-binding protein